MRWFSRVFRVAGITAVLLAGAWNNGWAAPPRGIVHTFSTPKQEGWTRVAVAGLNTVYLATNQGQIWRWNLGRDSAQPVKISLAGDGPISNLRWTRAGDLIVQSGRTLKIGQPDGTSRQFPFPELPQIAISPTGDQLAAVGQDLPIQFYSLKSGQKTHRVDRQVWVDELQYSPSGEFLATSRFGRLYLWKSKTGELAWKVRLEGNLQGFAFAPDQSKIFAAVERGGIWVIDVQSGRITNRLQRSTGATDDESRHRLTFSADGMLLGETERGNQILIWDTITGQPILWLEKHPAPITDLQFLPDGIRLVSVDSSGRASIWDLGDSGFAGSFDVGKPYGKDEMGQLWQMLGSARGEAAWTAMIALKHRPDQVLELIDNPPNDDLLIQRLIQRLENDHFRVRQVAFQSLRQLRLKAEPFLRATLKTTQSAEVTARIRRLLEYLSGPQKETQLRILRESETHRQLRLIQLLRWMGNTAARKRLESIRELTKTPIIRTQAENALKSMEASSASTTRKPN